MSKFYPLREPKVIDEEMLKRAVEEQGPQGEAGSIAIEEGIKYDKVLELRLDYNNILKIDHLWQFTSLTKLQLDNNMIEKIEGLEKLTNLLWLDLSFNKIEVIEGLNTLVKLQDLSLFSNCISVIENIDVLQNLEILSIGNNFISQLDNIKYLRPFKTLRTLNLAGNPLCSEANYKEFVAAYLSDLVYLDFSILDEQTRGKAFKQYQHTIEGMTQNEMEEKLELESQEKQEQEHQLHKDAFVENLNGSQLFDSMFADDADASTLASLPGVSALVELYRTQLVELCIQLYEEGLAQHTQRQAEVESFFTCFREAVADNKQRAVQASADFEKSRRKVMGEVQHVPKSTELERIISNFRIQVTQLCDTLMMLELQLVDQLEDIIKDFERNLSDMVGGFTEYVQGIFGQCRELENHHHEKLLEIASATLEKIIKNELQQSLTYEVSLIFVDKDTMIGVVSASHDTHLLKIDNREDELMTRIRGWMNELIKSINEDEVKRNSKRISEIHNYIDYVKSQLDDTTRATVV